MPPKTLNYRLQQTAGAGRLARNRGSSGPPPLISFPFWRASDRVRVIDEFNRIPRNNDHWLARDAAQQRSSDRCQPADHARMADRASPSFFRIRLAIRGRRMRSGDFVAAADRLRVLAEVPLLEVTTDVESLAGALLEEVPLPPKAATDALHIAVAAVNGVEYLLTWNCRHIANPALRPRIESVCRRMGFEPPVICTPQELLEIDDGN